METPMDQTNELVSALRDWLELEAFENQFSDFDPTAEFDRRQRIIYRTFEL